MIIKSFATCCCSCVVLILVLATGVAWIIAKTGIVHIPVISSFAYTQTEPERTVSSTPELLPNFEQQFSSWLQATSSTSTPFAIGENILTTLLRQAVSSSTTLVDPGSIQAIVNDSTITLYAVLQGPLSAPITVEVQPEIRDGATMLNLQSLQLGQLPLPTTVVEGAVRNLFEQWTASLDAMIRELPRAFSITATSGAVLLVPEQL